MCAILEKFIDQLKMDHISNNGDIVGVEKKESLNNLFTQ